MSTEKLITVLGANGWIGSSLVTELQKQGRPFCPVSRESLKDWLGDSSNPGAVIYTIGLTADFRSRPFETISAHITLLSSVMQRPGVETLIYASSTRVYAKAATAQETTPLPCLSSDPSDLYNLSKLMGESLILQDPRPGLKAVRLSNVVGPRQPKTNFIGALLQEVRSTGIARIHQSPETSKDYVALSDVARMLIALTAVSRERLYNLGTGKNRSHHEVAAWLSSQGATVIFAGNPEPAPSFPKLDVRRLTSEYGGLNDPFDQWLI
jgi:nucleoside-diphosphate-sugar epimerase